MRKKIVEKELGIPADYQYRAIHSINFIQSNWHKNKMYIAKVFSNFNNKMDVMDLGTGSGNFEILFNSTVKRIVGVDYNDEALNFLQKYLDAHKIANVKLVCSDIKKLSLPKNYGPFDLIVMIDVIEHLEYRDVKRIFAKFKNYLKKNGRVVIITPNYKSTWPFLEYVFDTLGIVPRFRKHQHLSKLYRSNLLELIKTNGYTLNKMSTFNLFSFLIPFGKLSEWSSLLETLFPISWGNLIVAVFSR